MDKIDRLLDAIEHPQRYSLEEIEALLANPEVREVYDLLGKTKATFTPIPEPDVDAEWNAFKNSHSAKQHRTDRIFNLFNRNIAASIVIGIASLAAVATVVGVSASYVLDRKTETRDAGTAEAAIEIVVSDDSITVAGEIPARVPETITFDNETLETVIRCIAEYYGCNVKFSTGSPNALRLYFRWNQALPLDEVVESLNNFEQINITVKDRTIEID